jgi:hypothetical protein
LRINGINCLFAAFKHPYVAPSDLLPEALLYSRACASSNPEKLKAVRKKMENIWNERQKFINYKKI